MSTVIEGDAGRIEALLVEGRPDGLYSDSGYVVVLCHPHPLYGGTMNNKVVTTLSRVYRELGITSLRFNFRGVGGSEGVHDEAVGEVDDLCRVSQWLLAKYPDSELLLAGFSFGSAVVAAAGGRLTVAHMTLVAPPVMRYSYAPAGAFACPVTVILGGEDDLVDAPSVLAWRDGIESQVTIILIPDATHFFHGQLISLDEKLSFDLSQQLSIVT